MNVPSFNIVESFCVGRNWRFYNDLKQKKIHFAFEVSPEEKQHWSENGFAKLRHLLTNLKKKYGLDNFELVFFRGDYSEPFYTDEKNNKNWVFANLDTYLSYGREINPEIEDLHITKYSKKIKSEFSHRVPEAFFNKEEPRVVTEELRNSYHRVLEAIIKEFENLNDMEKQELKKVLEHSKPVSEIIDKYVKLDPESPERQLKLFLKVIDKLGEEEVEELLNALLNSKISSFVIKNISKLPLREQNRIIRKMPEMAKMYDRYEKLRKSLREFKGKIREHTSSDKKDEKDIHRFLIEHYWLLGIEYFDKEIASDIDVAGKRTNETKIGNKRSDFIIKRLDSLDKCVVIELEAPNDKIFNEDGSISRAVYDGIIQAVDYNIEQKVRKIHSKGIAVIGSLSADNLTEEQKKRLRLLGESFHNVEILTYNEIIEKAETTLEFFKRYEKKGSN